jgi:hypothetical protein
VAEYCPQASSVHIISSSCSSCRFSWTDIYPTGGPKRSLATIMYCYSRCCREKRDVQSTGTGIPDHGRSGFFQANHSHLRRKALLNLSKSSIPSPPKFSGLVTKGHPTLHFPPEISLSLAQRKRRLALSKSTNSCLGALRDVRR